MMEIVITSKPIDQISCQALALSFFQDERPLQGSTGLIDWRIGGKLSRLMIHKIISGVHAETVLTPVDDRLKVKMIFLFGLGKKVDYSLRRYREITRNMVNTIFKMNVYNVVLPLPGVALSGIGYQECAEILLVELESFWRRFPACPSIRYTIVARSEVSSKIEAGLESALSKYVFRDTVRIQVEQ